MSDKTNYKRLWKQAQEDNLKHLNLATGCLKAMNLLLKTIEPKFTAQEFKDLLELIGADQVEVK